MRGKRARLLRAEANTRYDDGERNYEEHNHPTSKWRSIYYPPQGRGSFYRRLKDRWNKTKTVT